MAKHAFEGADAVVLDESGRLLLEKRSDVPVWALPGGGREHGEALEQTAVRETLEETGLCIVVKRFVGRYRSSYLFYRDNTHVFLCTVQGGTLRKNRESLQLGFFPLDRLPQPLLFIHEERIKDAVAGLESVDKVQKIALLRVLQTFRCNPLLLLKLAVFSRSRVF